MFVQELLLRKIKYLNIQACTVCLKSTQMFNISFGIDILQFSDSFSVLILSNTDRIFARTL